MKRPVWLLAAAIVALLAVWLVIRSRSGGDVAVDLVEAFPNAAERRPAPETFQIVDATINGEKKRAILTKDPSRLVYSVTVPDRAELQVSLGLLEEAWTVAGDGVLFRILISAGGTQDELVNLEVNPYGNPADRIWHDLDLDLADYAGETVQLFFNTNASPPSRPQRDDHNGDLAVWGAPRIVTR